jgi:uncharacterized membrane protein
MSDDNITDKKSDPEQRKIMQVYGMLGASLLLGFIPNVIFAIPALILFCCVPPIAGRIRRRADPASLAANHMTYIIRTIWIATLLAAVTTALATVYILSAYDTSPLQSCVDKLINSGNVGGSSASTLLMPCMDSFVTVNKNIFLLATLGAAIPFALYLVWRLSRGVSRAQKGYRLANVKSWF